MAMIIRGGTVVDTDPVQVQVADVLVADGRISAVGPGLPTPDGAEVVNADGMLVLPGFVDTHRHTWQAGLRAATVEGARVAALDDLGTLGPGAHADLVLLRTDLSGVAQVHDPVASVVLSMDTRAVDTVIVGGRIVKRDGRLLAGNVTSLLTDLAESAARVTATA